MFDDINQRLLDEFQRDLPLVARPFAVIGETLEIGWTLLETLPREDLHRIPEEAWARRAGRGAPS